MKFFLKNELVVVVSLLFISKTFGCFVNHNDYGRGAFKPKPSVISKSTADTKGMKVQHLAYFLPKTTTTTITATFYRKSSSQLNSFFNFFNNNENGNNDEDEGRSSSEGGDDNDDFEEDENEDYIGSTNIFKIDAKTLKIGACRLYLSLFFMGESNNPEKRTWRMNQNGDGGIDLYYKDATGALIVVLEEDAILVNRLGSSPSMEYLIQESSMLNGMLDQLDEIAMDTSISESDRLICIEGDAINLVRESLSFT